MSSSVELSVIRLILEASLFTKVIMSVLLTLSVISWAIMYQKHKFVKDYYLQVEKFLKLITSQDGTPLEEHCELMSKGVARTMPILIMKLNQFRERGRPITAPDAVINNAVMHDFNRLNQNMTTLATTANISPLIGLFGTVWGIMYSFINIGQMGNASIATVAPGIAEALITTFGGLVVAIPAMVGHGMIMARIYQCQDVLDRLAEISHSMFGEGKQS